jgi:hypothetical protein
MHSCPHDTRRTIIAIRCEAKFLSTSPERLAGALYGRRSSPSVPANLRRLVDIPSYEYNAGCCPAWAPDGSKIVFYSEDYEDYRIETMKPDGSSRKLVTNGLGPTGPRTVPKLSPPTTLEY